MGGFAGLKAQLLGPQLQQLAAGPQPRQRQHGIRAGGDDQPESLRHPFDDETHLLVHGPIFNEVIVVEDQRDLVVDGGQFVEQGGQNHLSRVGAHLDELERTRRHPRAGLVQRRDRAGPKSRRIIVGSIKGQPAAPTAVIGAAHPLRQKRRLAPARRRTEQRELARGFRRKDLDQSRPFDELSADGRWRRLGGKQHRRLASVSGCFALELEEGRRDAQQIGDLSAAGDDHALNANRGIALDRGPLGRGEIGPVDRMFQGSSRIRASNAADHALGAGAANPITKPFRSLPASGWRYRSSPSTPSRRHAR